MPVPNFETVMKPLLELTKDGKEHTISEAQEYIANLFNLSDEERKEKLPTGRNKLRNRISWARYYLKNTNLLSSPRRGVFVITNQGRDILEQGPEKVDAVFLSQLQGVAGDSEDKSIQETVLSPQTPDDLIERGFNQIQRSLEDELLERIKSKPPEFFENLIMELCGKMFKGSGRVTGRTGDGGIDGIVNRDVLGLEQIFLQAKRWEADVSRPEIQKFAGSLLDKQSKKGIFITTSDFSKKAVECVKKIEFKIILINGRQLVKHMINHNVGVKTANKYEIKKIDEDYFIEDE